MRNEFTAIIERDGECLLPVPQLPEANGQGHTPKEAKKDLVPAIQLLVDDRREDARRL